MAQSLNAFANDLLMAAAGVSLGARVVMKAGAHAMKAEAQENVRRSAPSHNAGAARAITYDEPSIAGPQVTTEVGYDKDLPGGALGNLLEYGGGGDRSPAHRDIGRAADSLEGRIGQAMQMMAMRLL